MMSLSLILVCFAWAQTLFRSMPSSRIDESETTQFQVYEADQIRVGGPSDFEDATGVRVCGDVGLSGACGVGRLQMMRGGVPGGAGGFSTGLRRSWAF